MTPPLDPLTLPLRGWQLIEASAGTGKTWTLAALYLRLVLGEPDGSAEPLLPPRILVMTYTEAATAELRGRIRERLHEAALWFGGQDTQSRAEEGPANARAPRAPSSALPQADDYLQALRAAWPPALWRACAQRLELAAEWMDEAAVHTIHAWCKRMLRQYALEAGLSFEQGLVDDALALKQAAARDWWRREVYPLDPGFASHAVAALGGSPGALRTLPKPLWDAQAARRGETLPAGPEPAQVQQDWLAWRAGFDTAQARALDLWATHGPRLLEQLRQALAAKVLSAARIRSSHLDRLQAWGVGLEESTSDLLARFSASGLPLNKGRQAPPDTHGFYAALDRLCAVLDAQPPLAEPLLAHAARRIEQDYAAAKARASRIDFDDMLRQMHRALHAPGGHGERLAATLARQFPVALIDEFQDTDPWQWESFARIYRGQGRALLLIGDPKQAIYAFRGAQLDTYLQARAEVLASDAAALHTLSGNYRSTAGVVAGGNRLFGAAERPFGDLGFPPATARNPRVPPLPGADGQPARAMTFWVLADGDERPLNKGAYTQAAAACAASAVTRLLGEGACASGDVAVLVRDYFEAGVMRDALAARGVPSVYLSDRGNVWASEEARDLWRLLAAVADPASAALLRAALATRAWGLPLAEAGAHMHDEAAWERLTERAADWLDIWRAQGVLPMLHRWLHDEGVAARLLAAPGGERRLTNLLHLGELLQHASREHGTPRALLRFVLARLHDPASAASGAQQRLESDASRVQIVTYHKAKGLEYPLVFLPFLSNFAKPAKGQPEADEDLRLLYVAFTRAARAQWAIVAECVGDLDDGGPAQARGALGRLLGRQRRGDLRAALGARFASLPDVAVESAPAPDERIWRPALQQPAPLHALVPTRTLDGGWWTASFTALVRGLGDAPEDARDARRQDARLDAPSPAAEEAVDGASEAMGEPFSGIESEKLLINTSTGSYENDSSPLPDAWPAGAAFGTYLHDLLETQAQRGWPGFAADEALPPADAALAQALALPGPGALCAWLTRVIEAPVALPGADAPFVLARQRPGGYRAEWAFNLPVGRLAAREIDRLLLAQLLPGAPRPPLAATRLHGMLTGFLDLVAEHEGRYWVIDYKSNRLPGYGRAELQASILAHRYELQYTLYLVALHRLLAARLPGYDYERHVGGAAYLYLRAWSQGAAADGTGWWIDKPPRALIEALDAALREEGV